MGEIKQQLEMGVDAIADDDRWMLEIDVEELKESSLSEQQYWLYAIEVARQAGTRALELSGGKTCSWADIMKDGKFALPTTNPLPAEEKEEDTAPPDQEPSGGKTCSWADIMKDGKFVLPTTKPLPVEKMEGDTAPHDQASEPPQPTPAGGQEAAGGTEVAEPQDAVPAPATTQSAGTSSCAAQKARRGGKAGAARRTSRKRGATDMDRSKKTTDRPTHRERVVPTSAKPKGPGARRTIPQKGGYGSLRSEAARGTNIDREAADADDRNLRLFKQWAELSFHDKRRLTAALRAPPRYEMVELVEEEGEVLAGPGAAAQRMELPAVTRGLDSISQANFRRLDDDSWLDDTTIDVFLQAYVNDACDKARCTRARFMSALLADNVGNTDYAAEESARRNFSNVSWYAGYTGLDYLFVPINIDNQHWIFLRVNFLEREINLYDSMGSVVPSHRKYMAAMRRYLYDANLEDEDSREDFDTWKHGWAIHNLTRDTPKQRNCTDCGVFTILSIYLSSRGVNLQRSTYTQDAVDTLRMRRSIALALMKANDTPPEGSVARHFARAPATNRATGAARKPRNRKRKRVESRVAVGSGNVTKPATPQSGTAGEESILNRKRSARSLADGRKRHRTVDQMLKIPRGKRARTEKSKGRGVPDM